MSSAAAVELALAGDPAPAGPVDQPGRLTPREREVAALIAAGCTNKAIAGSLYISTATAARHVANILAKLGFTSRAQIAAWAPPPNGRVSGPRTGR
jgi:DNA-binding NarL/FixJ family response regulator